MARADGRSRGHSPHLYRGPYFGVGAAGIGAFMLLAGIVSANRPAVELYATPLAGYDAPFDAIAGLLLLVLAYPIRRRSPVAWIFSTPVPLLACVIALLSPNTLSVAAAVLSAGFIVVLHPYRSSFYLGSATGPEGTSLLLVTASLMTTLLGMVGGEWLGSDFSPPVRGWGQSAYFTIATISTIGSQYVPGDNAARALVIILLLLGLGTFLSAIVVLVGPFLGRQLSQMSGRLERQQMDELEQHVIVCGASPEAQATARALREEGVRLVVLSADSAAVERLHSEGFRTHVGDPSSEEDLKFVGIDRARALIVAQESDASTLLTVITARAIHPHLRIVAVAASESSLAKLRRAGATKAIRVVQVAGQLISAAALDGSGTKAESTPAKEH
jgi:TrkA family protein/ion channel